MQVAKGFALVTGSSTGIGRAIALRLSRDGFSIIVHFHRDEAGAIDTKTQILNQGGTASILQFDVSDGPAVEAALDGYAAAHPDHQISTVVNNASITKDMLMGAMSDESFDTVMKTNLYGAFYLTRWCIKKMIRARSGCVVNVASLAGQTGNPGQVNYAASKAGLIALTKSLAMEVGSRNIRVNAVAPGLIQTKMIEQIPHLDEMKKRIPLGRVGHVDEVAGVVSFLCSSDASYVTGATISVNGGLFPA